LLRASEEHYNGVMAGSRQLDDQYEAVRKRTSELVELIKLQRARELMETYQRNERPDDEALQSELQRIRALEQRLHEALRR
jgi:hypothetical protein